MPDGTPRQDSSYISPEGFIIHKEMRDDMIKMGLYRKVWDLNL